MSLINCKAEPSLAWGEKCVLSGGEDIADGVIVANAKTLCFSSYFTGRR